MFEQLDPLLHSQLRLGIISILLSVEEADFVYLQEKTKSTSGNLSVQLDRLNEAGYIEVDKFIDGRRPRTVCKITPVGIEAFQSYVKALEGYLNWEEREEPTKSDNSKK